ncbi:MAG: TetR/AcrR family transcriptional regulator [Mycobacteriaceae bacterium]|nr:TetR/AcrR family transcriptional regulator [Mycobacteriaceae bacterium]
MATPAVPAHLARGRRSSRPSGDDRELAILATAERLLEGRPLADISVDDLAKGAGISRPTFYFYFPSKDAVLLTLFDRVIQEADETFESMAAALPSDPLRVWRDGIAAFFKTFGAHRAVTLASAAVRATNTELRELFSTFMQKWVAHTASLIRAERERGAAPETVPADDLAAALNLMNERTMFAAYAGERPAIGDEKVVDTLAYVWFTSIYGAQPT